MKVYILFVCYNYSTYGHKIQGVYKTYTEARIAQKQIWKDLSYIKEFILEDNKMVTVYEMRVFPENFKAIKEGKKKFEVVKNDKNYNVGEYIDLREFDIGKGYTGEMLCLKIVYMMTSNQVEGLKDGYCVLGIEVI